LDRSGDSYQAAGLIAGRNADPLTSILPEIFDPPGTRGLRVTFDGTTLDRTKFHLVEFLMISMDSFRVVIRSSWLRMYG
jgi:hypothetical protein